MITIDLDRARITTGQRVLDLGCGGGRHAFACLRKGAHVIAIDADLSEVRSVADMVFAMRCENEIDAVSAGFCVGDVRSLPVAEASFDRIIIAEVLEHIVEDTMAIKELVRILKPGGVLAVTVPRRGPERLNWALSHEYHSSPGGHVRIYRRRELINKVEGAGLQAIGAHHAHGLHSPYWWLRCIVGVNNEQHPIVKMYHKVLVWDIVRRPIITRALDRVLNPLIGKSLVVYFEKSC